MVNIQQISSKAIVILPFTASYFITPAPYSLHTPPLLYSLDFFPLSFSLLQTYKLPQPQETLPAMNSLHLKLLVQRHFVLLSNTPKEEYKDVVHTKVFSILSIIYLKATGYNWLREYKFLPLEGKLSTYPIMDHEILI